MIFGITLPPIRLANGAEDPIPGLLARFYRTREESTRYFFIINFCNIPENISPGVLSHLFPIEGRQNFQQKFLASQLEGPLINLVPDTGSGLINITMLGR